MNTNEHVVVITINDEETYELVVTGDLGSL